MKGTLLKIKGVDISVVPPIIIMHEEDEDPIKVFVEYLNPLNNHIKNEYLSNRLELIEK